MIQKATIAIATMPAKGIARIPFSLKKMKHLYTKNGARITPIVMMQFGCASVIAQQPVINNAMGALGLLVLPFRRMMKQLDTLKIKTRPRRFA